MAWVFSGGPAGQSLLGIILAAVNISQRIDRKRMKSHFLFCRL
jgi:hypothetical protein